MLNTELNKLSDEQLYKHRQTVAKKADDLCRKNPALDIVEAMQHAEAELLGKPRQNAFSTLRRPVVMQFSEATATTPPTLTGVPVFRAGDYPQGKYTDHDVQQLAANYNPLYLEAPLTPDHLQDGPAWGWWKRFYPVATPQGLELCGDCELLPIGASMWQSGMYKRRSIEIYLDLELPNGTTGIYPKAVSLLGAATPAVKGLRNMFTEPRTFDGSKVQAEALLATRVGQFRRV